jgi:hypothetical protein
MILSELLVSNQNVKEEWVRDTDTFILDRLLKANPEGSIISRTLNFLFH